jgi:hypothetical protein
VADSIKNTITRIILPKKISIWLVVFKNKEIPNTLQQSAKLKIYTIKYYFLPENFYSKTLKNILKIMLNKDILMPLHEK